MRTILTSEVPADVYRKSGTLIDPYTGTFATSAAEKQAILSSPRVDKRQLLIAWPKKSRTDIFVVNQEAAKEALEL